MKRGRKQDNTLPPSRSREIQRAFRQRRSDYIRGLELRIGQLEAEVDEILARHSETLRYTTAEVAAARSACRKKQKTKSKHSLTQFMDLHQLGEPTTPHSPACLSTGPDNSLVVTPATSMISSHQIRTDLAYGARYFIRDMNGGLSSGPSSPQYSQASFAPEGCPGNEPEYGSPENNATSILSRRSKPLLQLWNHTNKTNDSRLSSHSSNPTTSSQMPLSVTCNQYHNSNSPMDMFMHMDPVAASSDASSQLMSSLVFRQEMRAPPSSSLPSLLANSSPSNDPLPSAQCNSYHSNSGIDSPPYAYRTSHSQISDRLNPYPYTFIDPSNNSSSNVSGYHQVSPLSLWRTQSSMSDQTNLQSMSDETNLHTGSLSTLIAIASTRLDHFVPQESDCGHQGSTLQTSPTLINSSLSSDSSGKSETVQVINDSLIQDEYAKSTRTATPCSTSASEPKELDTQAQCDSSSRSTESRPFDGFGGNHNSSSVESFYHQSATKDWQDEHLSQFVTEGYSVV